MIVKRKLKGKNYDEVQRELEIALGIIKEDKDERQEGEGSEESCADGDGTGTGQDIHRDGQEPRDMQTGSVDSECEPAGQGTVPKESQIGGSLHRGSFGVIFASQG